MAITEKSNPIGYRALIAAAARSRNDDSDEAHQDSNDSEVEAWKGSDSPGAVTGRLSAEHAALAQPRLSCHASSEAVASRPGRSSTALGAAGSCSCLAAAGANRDGITVSCESMQIFLYMSTSPLLRCRWARDSINFIPRSRRAQCQSQCSVRVPGAGLEPRRRARAPA